MRDIYLGDSYDIVKRFWAESLQPVALLYAYRRFVPAPIRTRFAAVTGIPVLETDKMPEGSFGLLLDPDTGIPAEATAKTSKSHAPLAFIVRLNATLRPAYMICFDQSYDRRHELTRREQLERKRDYLRGQGIGSFYYNSHAPFLFMSESADWLSRVKDRLESLGVPEGRFELRPGCSTRLPT